MKNPQQPFDSDNYDISQEPEVRQLPSGDSQGQTMVNVRVAELIRARQMNALHPPKILINQPSNAVEPQINRTRNKLGLLLAATIGTITTIAGAGIIVMKTNNPEILTTPVSRTTEPLPSPTIAAISKPTTQLTAEPIEPEVTATPSTNTQPAPSQTAKVDDHQYENPELVPASKQKPFPAYTAKPAPSSKGLPGGIMREVPF